MAVLFLYLHVNDSREVVSVMEETNPAPLENVELEQPDLDSVWEAAGVLEDSDFISFAIAPNHNEAVVTE
ncbi:hypothetical protein [Streptomyces sp. NPDC127084]|uniref:hypothetical protein n=1 Tax=Streptomyces sp. NPDC127084 TaxID=3347133 RepID=UPI003656D15A